MTKDEIRDRLLAIEEEIGDLHAKRADLMEKRKAIDMWKPATIEAKLRAAIQRAFGAGHNIKVAVFRSNSEYNDEYNTYNPSLTLVDSSFRVVDHNIDVEQFVPDSDEQYEYYEQFDEEPYVENITINF
jgi:hypothetical protein